MVALNTTLQSVKAYQLGGIPPSILAYCMENSQYMDQYSDLLEEYHLVYWSGKYILKELQEGRLYDRKGNRYHVSFASGLSRGSILRNDSIQQYRLSFRKPLPHYNIPAFVFISLPA
jgi:hypothetical protein